MSNKTNKITLWAGLIVIAFLMLIYFIFFYGNQDEVSINDNESYVSYLDTNTVANNSLQSEMVYIVR